MVNISQSPYLFDESLQVLKFSAIASKVSVEVYKEQEEPQTVKKRPFSRPSMAEKPPSNKTRFSMLMEKKAAEKSLLAGRGSIAWENPVLSSTQKVIIEKIIRGLITTENMYRKYNRACLYSRYVIHYQQMEGI